MTNATRNDLTWIGGVFDLGLCIRVSKDNKDRVHCVTTHVACRKQLADELVKILGGRYVAEPRSVWAISGWEQRELLERVLPYLRCKDKRDIVRRVLMYRSTLRPGVPISKEVRSFRRKLLENRS